LQVDLTIGTFRQGKAVNHAFPDIDVGFAFINRGRYIQVFIHD